MSFCVNVMKTVGGTKRRSPINLPAIITTPIDNLAGVLLVYHAVHALFAPVGGAALCALPWGAVCA